MESAVPCTICGTPFARLCVTCRSAAYCSVECQQTDWLIHRQLCKAFIPTIGMRPYSSCYLVIFLPMEGRQPLLRWVDTREDKHTAGYFHPNMDHLLRVTDSVHRSYIGRGMERIRGNVLRGREKNMDVIDVWYLDPDVEVDGIITNQTLHNISSPLRDTWGEKFWEGPMVITMRDGNAFDPLQVKDVNLMAYRDTIDYLGFYRDGHGSMIDGIGKSGHLARKVMGERAGKVGGWRLNCTYDQSVRSEPVILPVEVPRAHPLLVYENDDPLQIPELLGFEWVVKAYGPKPRASIQLENELAQLLILRIDVKGGKWTGPRSWWNNPNIGSLLLAHRWRGEVRKEMVLGVCELIRDVVVPLMTEERAQQLDGKVELEEMVRMEGERRGLLVA